MRVTLHRGLVKQGCGVAALVAHCRMSDQFSIASSKTSLGRTAT